jgi:hypothetical protein
MYIYIYTVARLKQYMHVVCASCPITQKMVLNLFDVLSHNQSFHYFPSPALFKKCINLLTILFPWHYIIPAWNSYQILLYGTAIFTNLYPPPFSQLFSFQINRNTRSMPWDYINIVVCIKLSPSLVTGHFFFVRQRVFYSLLNWSNIIYHKYVLYTLHTYKR